LGDEKQFEVIKMPYGWYDDTKDWASPRAYDYGDAKKAYVSDPTKLTPRTYATRRGSPDMDIVDPKNKKIRSESKYPVIIGIDCTGSMSDWPREIWDRLPLLCQTLAKYKPDVEISFSVIGDAYCDSYPLQVADFGKGLELEDTLKAFYPEGGGGGQISETYELWGYYMLNNCETPNAIMPYMLVLGDENFYNTVNPKHIREYIGDSPETSPDSLQIWKALTQKYNVFHLHKDYGYGDSPDDKIVKSWKKALGDERVIHLPSKDRAVDITMGLIAKGWDQLDDFKTNISSRHSKGTVDDVLTSIKIAPSVDYSENSKTLHGASGKTSTKLV
jgi:hypothetical protein